MILVGCRRPCGVLGQLAVAALLGQVDQLEGVSDGGGGSVERSWWSGSRGRLYLPFEPEAANLFFQLVSSRYERASLIVTSNKPFGRWGEVFGDDVVAAAMIDRLVHHADVINLRGDSYRLKDRDLGRVPAATTEEP